MKYDVYNSKQEKVKQVELNPSIFEVEINQGLVHQVAMAQMSNSRQNLSHTKDKSEVKGGGRKPWRQKGTGRARHGSIRSPLWKGGGVTFGPTKDRNYEKKVNKKMRRKALFMCLTDRAKDKKLILLDKIELDEIKTKKMNQLLLNVMKIIKPEEKIGKEIKLDKAKKDKKTKKDEKLSVLLIGSSKAGELYRAGRNIAGVEVVAADSMNVVDILKYKNLVMDEKGLEVVEKTYIS